MEIKRRVWWTTKVPSWYWTGEALYGMYLHHCTTSYVGQWHPHSSSCLLNLDCFFPWWKQVSMSITCGQYEFETNLSFGQHIRGLEQANTDLASTFIGIVPFSTIGNVCHQNNLTILKSNGYFLQGRLSLRYFAFIIYYTDTSVMWHC